MSKIFNDFVEKEAQLKNLTREIEKLRNDDRLKTDLAFKEEVEEIIARYGKTAREAAMLIDPEGMMSDISTPSKPRKKRALKVYQNPHTQETLETRGGNNKTLRAWKEEYGDVVDTWVIEKKE